MTDRSPNRSVHALAGLFAAKVAQFEALLHEVIIAARSLEGHLGVDVLRPEGGGVYQIIFRYRGPTEHQTWMDSEQRSPRTDRRIVGRPHQRRGAQRRWLGGLVRHAGLCPAGAAEALEDGRDHPGCALPTRAFALSTVLRPLIGAWPLPVGLLLAWH